jgi:hypothetical protein
MEMPIRELTCVDALALQLKTAPTRSFNGPDFSPIAPYELNIAWPIGSPLNV